LEQNNLMDAYHDVIWSGPVHEVLKQNLQAALADHSTARVTTADVAQIEEELLLRWHNAVCRVLMNIQQYRHGGGLLIVPSFPAIDLDVKSNLTYDRVPQALLGLVQHQLLERQTSETIARHCQNQQGDTLPCDLHFDAVAYQKKLDEHRAEVLGCVPFISSLSFRRCRESMVSLWPTRASWCMALVSSCEPIRSWPNSSSRATPWQPLDCCGRVR
jgi:hypothetical protein